MEAKKPGKVLISPAESNDLMKSGAVVLIDTRDPGPALPIDEGRPY
jgi:hypothetical protein